MPVPVSETTLTVSHLDLSSRFEILESKPGHEFSNVGF